MGQLKKVIEGFLEKPYYNECEAGSPLGIDCEGSGKCGKCDVICDLIKEAFKLPYDLDFDSNDEENKFFGKKVKITIEVEE